MPNCVHGGGERLNLQLRHPQQQGAGSGAAKCSRAVRNTLTMGKKRTSMAPGDSALAGAAEKSSKKSKKRRRESNGGGGTSGGEKRTSSSSSSSGISSKDVVVLRCAAEDSVSPIVVSFANQTVPEDMGAVEFRVHEGEDEGREGQKVVMGDGGR